MSQQSGTPQVIGASITVPTTVALGLLDPTYLTIGTGVYNLETKSTWTLTVSTAAIGSGVIAVLGVSGSRWIDQGGASGFVTDAALASTAPTSGGTLIGINNPAERYTQASLQAILDTDAVVKIDLAASDGTGGTSLVATQNTGAYYSNTKALEAYLQAGGAKDVAQDATITTNTSNIAANTAAIAALQPMSNRGYFAKAIAAGLGASRFSLVDDDFGDNVIAAALNGKWALNGTPALSAAFPGGNVLFSADADLIFKSSNIVVPTPRTAKWALGARVRLTSVAGLSNGEGRFVALRADGSNYVAIGLFKDQSTTKFVGKTVVGGVTVFAASTISLDATAYHDLLLYWNNTSLFLSVDGETPVLITSTAANMYSAGLFERHGLEGPSGLMYLDYVCVAAAN